MDSWEGARALSVPGAGDAPEVSAMGWINLPDLSAWLIPRIHGAPTVHSKEQPGSQWPGPSGSHVPEDELSLTGRLSSSEVASTADRRSGKPGHASRLRLGRREEAGNG
jgi:hypothetical protein